MVTVGEGDPAEPTGWMDVGVIDGVVSGVAGVDPVGVGVVVVVDVSGADVSGAGVAVACFVVVVASGGGIGGADSDATVVGSMVDRTAGETDAVAGNFVVDVSVGAAVGGGGNTAGSRSVKVV